MQDERGASAGLRKQNAFLSSPVGLCFFCHRGPSVKTLGYFQWKKKTLNKIRGERRYIAYGFYSGAGETDLVRTVDI